MQLALNPSGTTAPERKAPPGADTFRMIAGREDQVGEQPLVLQTPGTICKPSEPGITACFWDALYEGKGPPQFYLPCKTDQGLTPCTGWHLARHLLRDNIQKRIKRIKWQPPRQNRCFLQEGGEGGIMSLGKPAGGPRGRHSIENQGPTAANGNLKLFHHLCRKNRTLCQSDSKQSCIRPGGTGLMCLFARKSSATSRLK